MDTTKHTSNFTKKKELPPLENPLILDVVASHVSQIEDIKNFRLVCKLWKDAIPEPWKSAFYITTIYQHANSAIRDNPEDNDAITLAQFRDVPDLSIFRKGTIELLSWKLEEDHILVDSSDEEEDQPEEPSLENWFWITFRSDLTSITFHKCDFPGSFTVFTETFLEAVPNLKTLRVINCGISSMGWDKLTERFCLQRKFFEHLNLRNVYLDLEASDEQFNHLWGPFKRSLPKLENVSVRRLMRPIPSYRWVVPLLRYWNDTSTMKTLTFAEVGEMDEVELYRFSVSHSSVIKTYLKVVWNVSKFLSVAEQLLAMPPFPYLKPLIGELHLSGHVFPNLCFLKEMINLKLVVWKNGEGLDNLGSGTTPYNIASYSCINISSFPKLDEIYIHSDINIRGCNCEPGQRHTAERAFKMSKRSAYEGIIFPKQLKIHSPQLASPTSST